MSDELVILPVKMSQADRDELKRIAKAEKKSVSDIARGLFSDYVKSRASTYSGQVPSHGGDRRSEQARVSGGRKTKTA